MVLVRGINVGGHRALPRAALRSALCAAGFDSPRTYRQSGNAVAWVPPGGAQACAAELAAALEARLGGPVPCLAFEAAHWATMVRDNPLAALPAAALHVTLLAGPPRPAGIAALAAVAAGADRIAVVGRAAYLYCPDGYGQTKLSHALLERQLGQVATTRNWQTVLALSGMLTAGAAAPTRA